MYRIHRFRHKRCDGSSNEKDEISLIYSLDEPFYRPPIGSKESFREFVAFVSFIFFLFSLSDSSSTPVISQQWRDSIPLGDK